MNYEAMSKNAMPLRIRLFPVAILCFAVFISACAQTQHQTHQLVESQLRANNTEAALQILDGQSNSTKTTALHSLNKAMVLRQMERYEESIAEFEKAKNQVGRLSPTSISESLMAYTLTEQFSIYKPTIYEHLFVNSFQIMNFLALDQLDSARVEALQIDLALTRLTKEGHFKEAAFARYITGLVFEANLELDNALIAYQSAYRNYESALLPIPDDLQQRIQYLIPSPGLELDTPRADKERPLPLLPQGQLLILSHIDFAPIKTSYDTTLVDPETGHIYRVSLPKHLTRDLDGIHFEFTLNQRSFHGQQIADIESIAMDDLNRKMPRLKARALSRNISKYALAEEANQEHEILGQMVNFLGAMLEQSDNRHWLTLPNKIHIARQPLDQGAYSLEIKVLDRYNNIIERRNIENIEITANQFTFVNFTWQRMPEHSIH